MSHGQNGTETPESRVRTRLQRPAAVAVPPGRIQYIIWSVIFGTALALGGSALEPFPIPLMNITAASPWVALLITLNKVVVRRRWSVASMYAVAGTIAIFTTYLGPPTILKPLYIIAGAVFDLATRKKITQGRLILGHLWITLVGFAIFWLIFVIMVPGSAKVILTAVAVAAPFHFGISAIIASFVFKIVPEDNKFVRRVQSYLREEA